MLPYKYTYKYTHKLPLLRLFVVVYLLAALLPAGSRSASAQSDPCQNIDQQAASAGTLSAAATNQKVKIPKETVNRVVHDANWRRHYKDGEAVKEYFIQWIMLYDRSSSKYELRKMEKALQEFRDRFDTTVTGYDPELRNMYPYDELIHTMFDIALNIPDIAPAVPSIWRKLSSHKNFTQFPNSAAKIATSAGRYQLRSSMLYFTPQLIKGIHYCALNDQDFAKAYDAMYRKRTKNSIRESAKTILQSSADLEIPEFLRENILEDGSLSISLDDIKIMGDSEFARLHASIDDIQKTVGELDQKQDIIVDYLQNQQEREQLQALAQAKAAEYQLQLEAIASSFAILGSLAEQIDPKFAQDFSVVANSSLQIGVALNSWLTAVSGLSGLDKVASLSTVVMTGNVLGAVMNIVSLFGESGPSPDQMILEEIGRLRQQVDQLRNEMHDRFDRIDQELNTIYTTMHQRFDQIDIQLGKINGNIQEVQQSLLTLDLKLSRIERNNFEFLNTLGRRPLLDAINGGLGYEDRTGVPMPYQPDFVNFENTLHGWATIHAFDALNAGPEQRDYNDGQLLAELNAYPIDSNLNYLNGWLVTRNLPPIAAKRLASPRDWLFASRAYSQLGLEWPGHMQQLDFKRPQALVEIAMELETAMRNLSTIQTGNGPQGNTLLFSTVITQYQNKLDALDSALHALEIGFHNEVQASLQRNEPFDLYGGIDQSLAYIAPELTTATCADPAGHGSHPAPGTLASHIPPVSRYTLADYLGIGKLTTCLHYEMGEEQEVCYTEPDPPYAQRCDLYVGNRAVATVYFDNISILRQSVDGPSMVPYNDWYVHYSQLMPHWTEGDNYKTRLEALATADHPAPDLEAQRAALLAATTDKLEATFKQYQQIMYGRLLNELTQGSLLTQATEVAGSKALLDAVVSLGLPRAIANDEFLHALLFGQQRLVDSSQIAQTYSLSATQPITGTSLQLNPRLLLGQTADARMEAFTGILYRYLSSITAKTHKEEADYLADARRGLALTVHIAQVDVAPSPDPTPTPSPSPSPGPLPEPTPSPSPSPSPGPLPEPSPSPLPVPTSTTRQIYLPVVKQ